MNNVCWLGMGLFCLVIGAVVVGLALLVWFIVWLLRPARPTAPAEQVLDVEARPAAEVVEAPAELPEPPQQVVREVVEPFAAGTSSEQQAASSEHPRLYRDYSRQEVHDIFAPDTPFTAQAGTWGLHGIVKVPEREGDFVFFVTFGQEQGDHAYEEGISADGVLNWQSQPSQGLDHTWIQQFIQHDEQRNHIYLFLRTQPGIEYTYLGELKYLWHDPARERPVYFRWQILDWRVPPAETVERMGLKFRVGGSE